ncbi:MAG TPA: AAA family ATPase [Jiangellaceae bacterium]
MSPRRGTAFIKRESEVARLTDALAAAAAGSPSMVVVSADAGVGKTRLLNEVLAAADGPVLWGYCLPMGKRGLPLAPIVEALRGLHADAALADRIPRVLLSLLSPRDDDAENPSVSRTQLFQAILELLEGLAAEATTVLVLEDLHWADQSTRDVLTFLVPNLRDQRLLLVGSYRTDGLTRDDPLRDVMAEIARYPQFRRHELEPFTVEQVADQIELLTGSRPSPEVVDLVYARSQGNAYFVEELVAAGLDRRDLPASLRDLLLVRAGAVSAPARRLLGVASLAVMEVGDSLLADVSGAPVAEVREQLHELIDAHLLVSTSSGVRFRHALMREVLQGELLAGERREYHAAYARARSSRSEPSAQGRAASTAQLAYHLQEAGDLDKAIGAWAEAATEAEAVAAFAEAHDYLANALAVWDQVEDPEAHTGGSKVQLLVRVAEDAFNGGDPAQATAFIRQAIGLVDEAAHPRLAGILYERLSRYLRVTPESDKAFEAIKRALELVPPSPPSEERARVLAGYSGRLSLLGQLREAGAVAEQAVAMAREVGAAVVECGALNTLGVVTCYLDDDVKGLHQIEDALTLAKEIGDPYQQMRSHWNLHVCASEAGRWEESVARARQAIAELPRLGHGHQLPEMYTYLQEDLVKLGRFDQARAVADEAVRRFPARRDEALSIPLLIALGDFDAARRVISRRDVFEDEESRMEVTGQLSDLETWDGNTDAARDALDVSLQLSTESDRPIARATSLMVGLRCEANAADGFRTRRLSRELELAVERGRTFHKLMAELTSRPGPETGWKREVGVLADVCEGEYTRLTGEPDPRVWSGAVAAAERLSMAYLGAYAEFRLAEAIVISDGDKAEATRRLRRVHQLATQWGTRPLRQLIERFAARARIDIGVRAAVDDQPHGLTPRERQVLDLIARGASNRQISEELFISEKTTSVHVSNILRKLGVVNRGEAASLAYEKGWVGY